MFTENYVLDTSIERITDILLLMESLMHKTLQYICVILIVQHILV